MQKTLENCEEVLNFYVSPKNTYRLLSWEDKIMNRFEKVVSPPNWRNFFVSNPENIKVKGPI